MGHLITPEFEELFEKYPTGSQRELEDPLVIAKLFDQFSPATWFLLEYDKQFNIALAYVVGIYQDEPGSVNIKNLEKIIFTLIGKPKIKQDFNFTKKPLSEALKVYREEQKIA
jgi:hypothetical protein